MVMLFYGNPQFKNKTQNESHSFSHRGKEVEYANPWVFFFICSSI